MRSAKISTAFLIICFCLQISVAQTKSEAFLVHQIKQTGCENYAALLDQWFKEVLNTPGTKGYALIRGSEKDFFQRLHYREWIYGHLRLRFGSKAQTERFVAVESPDAEDLEIQLWSVPEGAAMPFQSNSQWNHRLNLDKPFVFYESVNNGDVCPYFNDTKVFAELLRANPDWRGHIVFYENGVGKFQRARADFLQRMDGISRDRLRTFRVQSDFGGHYELWLVPRKR